MHTKLQQVFLIILDGWGWSPISEGNLLAETSTPGLDTLLGLGHWTLLKTASLEVGLPWGSVGDSELGHYNMGTGRVVVRRGGAGSELLVQLTERATAIAETPNTEFDQTTPLINMTDAPVTSLGTIMAGYGLSQAKIAVADKLPLLTHALNGYPSLTLPGEQSLTLTDEAILRETLLSRPDLLDQSLVVINLSLADLAAHRGDLRAVREAITTTDQLLQKIYHLAAERDALLYLVADHGNIEQMLTEHELVMSGHTTAPVLFARIDCRHPKKTVTWATHEQRKARIALSTPSGLLADVCPTILEEFGLPAPDSMVGISLRQTLIGR